jgi:cytochrome c-type biogenesis protein CcmE
MGRLWRDASGDVWRGAGSGAAAKSSPATKIVRKFGAVMKRRHQRIGFVLFALCSLSIAAALALKAFNRNLIFYFTPSQVAAKEAPVSGEFRLGGLVVVGSLTRDADGLTTRFSITDTVLSMPVVYRGILPDLFKEGRGCVAQGKIGRDGTFDADQVLAKHDENYMPPGTK